MKKKEDLGITLIALVITIIILLILAGISIVSLTGSGLFGRAKESKEVSEKTQIKEEIEMTIMDIQIEEIAKGNDIILEMLADGEDMQLANKLEGITATLNDDEINGEYKGYEYTIDNNLNVTVGYPIKGISFSYILTPKGYTNGNIALTVNAKSTNGSITNIEVNGLTRNADGTFTITENKEYQVTVTDSIGESRTKLLNMQKIDTIEPTIVEVTIENVTLNGFTIKVTAEDGEATTSSIKSGIEKCEYYVKGPENAEYVKYNSEEIDELNPGTTYKVYVIAYDKAGNDKMSETIDVTTSTKPLPPKTKMIVNEETATKKVLDYPTLTLDGMMNYNLEPNIGENITIEITSPKVKNIKYYYSVDSGSTWKEYIEAFNTEYKGEDLIKVKAIYKDKIESNVKNVKNYKYDSNVNCQGKEALPIEAYDRNPNTYAALDPIGYSVHFGVFEIEMECYELFARIVFGDGSCFPYKGDINDSGIFTDKTNGKGEWLNAGNNPISTGKLQISSNYSAWAVSSGTGFGSVKIYEVSISEK